MSKNYEIRNNKGDVTGTITPASQSSSSGPSSAVGDAIGTVLLASIFGSVIGFFTFILWGPLLLLAYERITGQVAGDHSTKIAIVIGGTVFVGTLWYSISIMGVRRFLSGFAVIIATLVAIVMLFLFFR